MFNVLSPTEAKPFEASCAPRHYMLGHDLKCHAWCSELDRIVTASEIWNLMFGDEDSDTTLSFYCVDASCRAHLILKNCYAYMSAIEAQFRLYPRARHQRDCSYIIEQGRLKNKLIGQRREQAKQHWRTPRSQWCR